MIGYRNVVYRQREQAIILSTWDDEGKRVERKVPYHPYLYLEDSSNGTDKSIYGTKVRKKIFTTQYNRYKFVKDSGLTRMFENLPGNQQFLLDQYWEHNEEEEFNQFPLKTQFIDIEAVAHDEFPDATEALYPINVVTIYDTIEKKKFVWGLGPFDSSAYDDVVYVHCKTEQELLEDIIHFIEQDPPDILSGWNSEGFDMPYIINRIINVLGEEELSRLSPVGNVYSKHKRGIFGQDQVRWFIDGISCIDYLDIYKRFQLKNRESYKLDSIAEIELNMKKLDYGDMHIADLCEQDWQKFVEYNIHDVYLLQRLDEELRYVELLRMLSYIGLTTFEAAMGAISVINGAAAIRARVRGQKIATFVRHDDGTRNPGAYVGEPERGFQDYVVSYDANSLYPNIMISLNMSPETKVGKLISYQGDTVKMQYVNGQTFTLSTEDFGKLVKDEELALSKANILFSQKKKGIMPEMVDYYYQKRVEVNKQLGKLKRAHNREKDPDARWDLEMKMSRLHTKQLTIKVLINSAYGYFGNKHSPMGDDDIASSITLCGQAVIKQSNNLVDKFMKDYGVSDDYLKFNPSIVYNDTDSCYVTLKSLFDAGVLDEFMDDEGNIADDVYEKINELTDFLNVEIIKWATATFNSKDCRLLFKREVISDIAMFLEKKKYVMHVIDDEGIIDQKYKYVGVDVVRTTMPKNVKPKVKNIITTMLETKSQGKTDAEVVEAYDYFNSLPVGDAATIVGLGSYDKYLPDCKDWQTVKGMPSHAKGSYFYNRIIKELKLTNSLEEIKAGDKVKRVYVKPGNKYGIDVICFKYDFPPQFEELFDVDYELMFEKVIFSAVQRYYKSVNWFARKPNEQIKTDLFELFG